MKNKLTSLLVSVGLLGASQAFATPQEITIADFNTTLWGFSGAGGSGAGVSNQGNFGIAKEDNETEGDVAGDGIGGTISNQLWDMEAFVLNGTTLYIVGGYNMQAGAAGSGGSVVGGMLTPGDLFIKVDGSQPTYNPTSNSSTTIANGSGSSGTYGYTYAVDLTQPVGATDPLSAKVIALNATSILNTAVYDSFGANPWKYSSGGTVLQNTGITYTSGLNDAAILGLTGVSLQGGSHNVLAVDLAFLGNVPNGTNVWFSYTMECGNDSLKGKYWGGFYRTPDSASSVLLIGLGLAAMGFFGLRSRR